MTRFTHLRGGKSGDVTMAYDVSAEGDSDTPWTVTFGFAFCSPKDQFNKSFGRSLANARLTTIPLTVPMKGNLKETKKFILRLLVNRKFQRLGRSASVYPPGLPKLVPGWLPGWAKSMQSEGALCLKAENPIPF